MHHSFKRSLRGYLGIAFIAMVMALSTGACSSSNSSSGDSSSISGSGK